LWRPGSVTYCCHEMVAKSPFSAGARAEHGARNGEHPLRRHFGSLVQAQCGVGQSPCAPEREHLLQYHLDSFPFPTVRTLVEVLQ